jgi:hypothetical protein
MSTQSSLKFFRNGHGFSLWDLNPQAHDFASN